MVTLVVSPQKATGYRQHYSWVLVHLWCPYLHDFCIIASAPIKVVLCWEHTVYHMLGGDVDWVGRLPFNC